MTLPTILLSVMSVTLPPLKPQPYKAPLDAARLADCIEAVENTPNHVVGLAGERSSFQVRRIVWEKYSTMPFRDASSSRAVCRAEVRRVALAHIDGLRVELARAGLPDTPFWVALSWSAGATATITGNASARKREYAHRCENIYHDRN